MGPVINLKRLNSWFSAQHFKMEGIPTLHDLLQQGDWLGKVDLKDAYFSVPIHMNPEIHCRGGGFPIHLPTIWPVLCLMGAFTKVLKSVVTLLRTWKIRMVVYIDNILILGKSPTLVVQHLLIQLLECLGFIVNKEKSITIPLHKSWNSWDRVYQ